MGFDKMMNDTIYIEKGGKKFGPFKAVVSRNRIVLSGNSLIIETGDKVIRQLSNGGNEIYTVTDPCFYEEFGGTEAHYQLHVKKDGADSAKSPNVGSITIQGNNNRFNINSNDNSINIKNINQLQSLIDRLRDEIISSNDSETAKAEYLEIVEEISAKAYSDRPNKSLIRGLLDSLPTTASILSIASSIMAFFK